MPEGTQRDLRSRSREIMDAVERGESFTVTGDGYQIGELIPTLRSAAGSLSVRMSVVGSTVWLDADPGVTKERL